MKNVKKGLFLEEIEEIINPKHTALLVIDVQNDNASPKGFLASKGQNISWATKIVPIIKLVLEEARRLNLFIIFTRMTRSRDGSHESGPRLRMLEKGIHTRGRAEYEMEETWGNEVLDGLEPKRNERQIVKYRSSSFLGTSLDTILRNRGIETAVVVGLVTEGCVESTVRDLEQYGYYPVILRDCVSSPRKDLHDAALLVMSARYDTITSEKLLDIWRHLDRREIY